jgi:putative FmdB family regulatory protein
MPTYQYACTSCGEPLEAVQKFTDDPLTECPACGGALRKVFSAVGVVFKGSGFYKTDSRAKKSSAATTPAAKGDKAAGSSSDSSPSGDAKPAAADSPASAPTGGQSSSGAGSDKGPAKGSSSGDRVA